MITPSRDKSRHPNSTTPVSATSQGSADIVVVTSYHNDTSSPLREMEPALLAQEIEHEDNENPALLMSHINSPDSVVQHSLAAPNMPATALNFDGITSLGSGCTDCAPPDTNGEAGQTQYVQMVNLGYQVFNKTTGASVLGPVGISTLWSGFGGPCENGGSGDPIVLYDQLANRWIITQFAVEEDSETATDECIAVSTTSDATGTYHRYGFHLGTNFYDYPKLAVWPDGYYMSTVVFSPFGSYIGPQPFAFDRAKMLAGQPAAFITLSNPLGGSKHPFLPADLDGSTLPPGGAPETFVAFPGFGQYTTYHFHADFDTPGNSSWTTFASPAAAGFSALCLDTYACVPEANGDHLAAIGDRLMHRLAYRNFGDHESVVGNYTVDSGGVAGVRWFELRNVN